MNEDRAARHRAGHRRYSHPSTSAGRSGSPAGTLPAIALGILTASGQLKSEVIDSFVVVGELALDGTLRSHGGRYEEMVPMLISHPLNSAYKMKASRDPRNFDIFDFTVNGTH